MPTMNTFAFGGKMDRIWSDALAEADRAAKRAVGKNCISCKNIPSRYIFIKCEKCREPENCVEFVEFLKENKHGIGFSEKNNKIHQLEYEHIMPPTSPYHNIPCRCVQLRILSAFTLELRESFHIGAYVRRK